MENKSVNINADILGIISAALCLLHCAALPALVVLSTLKFLPSTMDWHWLHYAFIIFSMVAVYWSCKTAGSTVRTLFWGFFILFATALLLHELSPVAIYISFSASVGLVILHGMNYRKKAHSPAKKS